MGIEFIGHVEVYSGLDDATYKPYPWYTQYDFPDVIVLYGVINVFLYGRKQREWYGIFGVGRFKFCDVQTGNVTDDWKGHGHDAKVPNKDIVGVVSKDWETGIGGN